MKATTPPLQTGHVLELRIHLCTQSSWNTCSCRQARRTRLSSRFISFRQIEQSLPTPDAPNERWCSFHTRHWASLSSAMTSFGVTRGYITELSMILPINASNQDLFSSIESSIYQTKSANDRREIPRLSPVLWQKELRVALNLSVSVVWPRRGSVVARNSTHHLLSWLRPTSRSFPGTCFGV